MDREEGKSSLKILPKQLHSRDRTGGNDRPDLPLHKKPPMKEPYPDRRLVLAQSIFLGGRRTRLATKVNPDKNYPFDDCHGIEISMDERLHQRTTDATPDDQETPSTLIRGNCLPEMLVKSLID